MALDDTDRRRFIYAALVSLLALPALWWVNREESTAGPKLATAGVEVAANPPSSAGDDPVVVPTIGESNLPTVNTMTVSDPIFLDGPVGQVGGVTEIAIPASTGETTLITEATYRSTIRGSQNCFALNIQPGRTITIINLDNNRRTSCRVALAPANQTEDLVMHTERFIELADLTDAPIPVEIRL